MEGSTDSFWINKNPEKMQWLSPQIALSVPVCLMVTSSPLFKERITVWLEESQPLSLPLTQMIVTLLVFIKIPKCVELCPKVTTVVANT